MSRRLPLIARVWNTAVFWTWMFNGLRFANGLLLMPLLFKALSKTDLGIYALFFQFTGFLLTFDQMFAVTIARFVGYALRGVNEVQGVGLDTVEHETAGPNVVLLGRLLHVGQLLYRLLSAGILLLLGILGTWLLWPAFGNASVPRVARIAWGITVFSAVLELYTGYAVCYLRGLNKMLLSARLSTLIYGFKLILAAALLLARFGLLAVPIATLITGVLQRVLARYFLLRNLPSGVQMDATGSVDLLRRVWPSSWRVGAVLLSINLMIVSFGLIISQKWGVEEVAPYHFSQQLLYAVCIGMASVWTFVKWPEICQLRAARDFSRLRRVVRQRLWLSLLTYAGLAAFFIVFGPPLLKWVAPEKQLLSRGWLALLAVYALNDLHYAFWTTLIATENRVPSMWAAVLTNLCTVALAFILATYTALGWGSFVLAPLLCGLVFNFWFWPKAGAASIGTHWFKFMFRASTPAESSVPPSGAGRVLAI